MKYSERVEQSGCPVERTVDIVGGRWTTLIVSELLRGTKRYGQLRSVLTGVSPKTLTDKLRELEEHGVVTRTVYASVPPKVEYTLTEKGQALDVVIDAMRFWGQHWT
ncbi:winged helix-turn-helix transcriptional regulator [Deinococcus hopiensis]|uniref:Transcriptional regulator, HxlR family n=1 Tax=Deinococcus hopiensis KR-140 TaxID=695939 RepID=A0A1W1USL5_9DEIO|nr:helix-turn-helix domain-containing protein [Deinococcus hopiensis]SMB84009.1 transcriptional regulator, HxlR family [Deinococcus hopiensis KR-140]